MGWPVLGYLVGKNFRRRGGHLVPPRRTDAAVYRAEVCYPFGWEHGRHRAVKRRDFITLLGGAAAAWPLAARAQQAERMRRIGMLLNLSENDVEAQRLVKAFGEGLAQLGWADGRNLRIDYRWAGGDVDRIRTFAKELVELLIAGTFHSADKLNCAAT